MAKAYWIAHVDVENADRYPDYISTAKPAFERYNANFLARGGKTIQMEGNGRTRNVVIEFASYQDAVDCYNSPEYQAAKAIRLTAATADMMIIEGA
ncbi:MAG: DUF1330 domain-containing protein [Rhizobiaceae bacterium]